jgi:hypothetical protein
MNLARGRNHVSRTPKFGCSHESVWFAVLRPVLRETRHSGPKESRSKELSIAANL